MRIRSHRLADDAGEPVPFIRSPNQSAGIDPRYLVMHYTGATSVSSAINWLTDPKAKASAHLVIDRDGSITQLVGFDRKAWHAGKSAWDGLKNLNAYSIGIELVNAGPLVPKGDGWVSQYGRPVAEDDIVFARHKNQSEERAWQAYPEEQLAAALSAGLALARHYGLTEVVGHDDIAPHRKEDPGPAFPMASFAAAIEGREQGEGPGYRTKTALNIRTGPGTEWEKLPVSPLPEGTGLDLLRRNGVWAEVSVLDGVNGDMDIVGWVHSHYIQRV